MLTEKEFNLSKLVNKSSFIKREGFPNDDEFNYSCTLALEMLAKGIFYTQQETPYIINRTGQGPTYKIVGELKLSTIAQDAIKFGNFHAYSNSQKSPAQWGLGNRLALWGIIIAILGLAIPFMFNK